MPRVLNKDGVAAKKHHEADAPEGADDKGTVSELRRVRTDHDRTIINGHVLMSGSVVEMTEEDIVNHRRHGVPLLDVADDDDSEVTDVSEPFVADGNGKDG